MIMKDRGRGSVLRQHWKRFIFGWMIPVVFFTFVFFVESKYASVIFFGVYGPIILSLFFVASKPYRARQVSMWQAFWWVCAVPFLVVVFVAICMVELSVLMNHWAT
jgi:amino acid permease